MRPLLLAALLLAVPAVAADEPATTEQTDVFEDAAARITKGDWKGAAKRLGAVVTDPARASDHAAAWGYLGKALATGGFEYAALAAWGEGLAQTPIALTPHYPEILRVADDLGEDAWIGGLVGTDLSVPLPGQVRSHVALLAARHHFAKASWGPAIAMLALVDPKSEWGLEAEVLRGVVLAQQSRYADSLAALLPARERAMRANRDDHYVANLSLNVARTFFASGNFGRAMEYYAKVGREDASWPQAHFERAWAHFRVDDMAGALALLHTHHSPFFDDWYFPEAELVRAQALFLMCKFPEATKTIDGFQARYQPMAASLASALGAMTPAQAFDDGRAARTGGSTRLPEAVARRFTYDDRVATAMQAVDQADDELSRLAAVGAPWTTPVVAALKARRDARVDAEGDRILDLAASARRELDDMLEGIELTRIDLLTLEADLYSRAAATGEAPEMGDQIGRVRKLRRKGKQVWPFEGEYWVDELGWYRIDARPDCPRNMARGEPQAR